MDTVKDILKEVSETGDIWGNPWWLKKKWREQFNIDDEKYRGYFSLLKEEFNEEWIRGLKGDIGFHPLIQEVLFSEGTPNIRNLLSLAENISRLNGVIGFNRVLKDYKTIQQARNAELELFMARIFASDGCDVEFVVPKPSKGKTPDILVKHNNREFAVECKYLDKEKGEKWIFDYSLAFGAILNESVSSEYSLYYYPYNLDIDIWEYGYNDNLIQGKLAAEIDTLRIRRAITQIMGHKNIPSYTEVSGKGELMVLPYSDEFPGQIRIPELNNKFFLKRLLLNGVSKASEQIRAFGVPGVAAIFYSGVAHIGELTSSFRKLVASDPEKYKLLMGALVFPEQNILHYVHPYWITNDQSEYSAEEYGVKGIFDRFFEPI